jgi:quinolinate synthase
MPTTVDAPRPLEAYERLSDAELDARIRAAKAALGSRLLILGHHYQRDEIVKYADFLGDSYRLSQRGSQSDAEFIIFCGVHFMAESATSWRSRTSASSCRTWAPVARWRTWRTSPMSRKPGKR